MTLIPERYTGYSGPDAARVWGSIYHENCFGLSESNLKSGASVPVTVPDTLVDHGGVDDEQCLEKRVYYKVISGRSILTPFWFGVILNVT